MEKNKFYITTPIYYANNNMHIGHSYCTVATDTMARYKKLRGYDVKFLTGSDEHGQKIENVAKEKGVSPKEYVDKITENIKALWKTLNIDYDYYIRTTDDKHIKTVQKIFKTLYEKGDIYKGTYEGLYCTPCETFFTETQLNEGKCPDCGRDVQPVKEESYFFKISKYQDRLIKHIEENEDFIQPVSRKNEMLNNFLKPGLEDLCVSRTSFKWGIPVDFDKGHVVYVWIDALSNYISALGYGSENDEDFKKYWPADIHVVGKEIVRFHSIIWPAMLMALDLPLPKKIFGHGWLLIDGGKMSKSKGNVVDPNVLVNRYGVDAIRYFLLREVAFGQDGNFTNEALIQRINSDLANDLGNLLSRTVGMIDKYFDGKLPLEQKENEFDAEIKQICKSTIKKTEDFMDKMLFNNALTEIWTFIRRLNKYIDETTPWILAKKHDKKPELANIMYTLAESLRIIAVLISPAMPNTPNFIYSQLCIDEDKFKTWDSIKTFGLLKKDVSINKGDVVFPRLDIEKELENLNIINEKTLKTYNEQKDCKKTENKIDQVTFDDFLKMDFKVGEILECEKIKKSNKLLKSQVKIGEKVIQIVSGISNYYTPEEMIGKRVIVLTNLKPAKLCGELSEGMILAASDNDNNLKLISVDDAENIIKSGSEVK